MDYLSRTCALALALLLCVASAEGSSRCRLWLSFLSRPSVTAAKVIAAALDHPNLVEQARGGSAWLDYLRVLSEKDLSAPAAGNRRVPLDGELLGSLEFMLEHVDRYQSEAIPEAARDKLRLGPVLEALLKELKSRFRGYIDRKSIERSELLVSTRVFSVASTYRLYLQSERPRDVRLYGNTPHEVWNRARHGASETALDRRFGITALPYPITSEIFPKDFLFAEPTSLILLGVSTRFQSVDAIDSMDPAYFLEHDKNHVEDRFDPEVQLNIPYAVRLSQAFPLDRLLRAGMLEAFQFLKALTEKIETLSTPEKQRLAEAIVFFLFREQRYATPIVDFNPRMLQWLSQRLLAPAELKALHGRLLNRLDLGSILLEEPTGEELETMVKWLGKL